MRIAITGGSGSLGRALLTQLTQTGAERIVVFSRDEQRRAALTRDFGWHPGVRVLAGDIRDAERLIDIFSDCEAVVHAAARKVVTAHPDEAREMLQTNVLGTVNVINAARAAGVRKLLFISSDKAVHAENVYGVGKAMAEHLVINENAKTFPKGLRMAVLRYGNVVGSTGSVVRVWRAALDADERLHLSDARMTRFWVTLPQAVGYVLQALADLRGGEIFVPKLPAAPVTTLLAAVAGGRPHAYDVTGVRPGGEKLHEALLSPSEAARARVRNGFYIVPPYQTDATWDASPWLGEELGAEFAYRSDTWPLQLDVAGMQELLA